MPYHPEVRQLVSSCKGRELWCETAELSASVQVGSRRSKPQAMLGVLEARTARSASEVMAHVTSHRMSNRLYCIMA